MWYDEVFKDLPLLPQHQRVYVQVDPECSRWLPATVTETPSPSSLDPTVLRLQTDPIWSEIVTFLFQLKQNPFGKLPVHQICQIITAVSARDPGA